MLSVQSETDALGCVLDNHHSVSMSKRRIIFSLRVTKKELHCFHSIFRHWKQQSAMHGTCPSPAIIFPFFSLAHITRWSHYRRKKKKKGGNDNGKQHMRTIVQQKTIFGQLTSVSSNKESLTSCSSYASCLRAGDERL